MRRVKAITRVAATLLTLLLVVPAAAPMTAQADGTDTVYVTRTGDKYHTSSCRYVRNKNNISTMTRDQAKSRGLTACSVCSGGVASSSSSSSSSNTYTATTTSATTSAAAQTTTNVAADTTDTAAQAAVAQAAAAQAAAEQAAATSAASTTTAEQAVQQAYALYVQNGMDSNTALARVNSKLAEFVAQPGSIAQIVQNDLTSLASAGTTTGASAAVSAATGLTAADAVQKAYALYVQSGMDSNSALARVNSKLAEFAAQPDSFAQIVQNDLASAGAAVTAVAGGISVSDAVQQAYALYVQNGLNSDTAFARVQGLLTQIAAHPDSYAQIVANDLAAQQ